MTREPIRLIYEDDDLLIVDKPAGVTVNRAETTKGEVTVQDWAEERFGEPFLKAKEADDTLPVHNEGEYKNEFYSRGGVVHRLDKETSGVMILAKNPTIFAELQKQFRERTVKKTYQALAHGKILPEEGEIDVPVGRLPWNRNRFGILPDGRESKTIYKVLQYYKDNKTKETLSFVALYPQSGRTHQIRVHLKYIGHPIFADFLYAGRKTSRRDRLILARVFLHAGKISFTHPKSGETVSFESPLPQNLQKTLDNLTRLL